MSGRMRNILRFSQADAFFAGASGGGGLSFGV
jgi:hypothetical protein